MLQMYKYSKRSNKQKYKIENMKEEQTWASKLRTEEEQECLQQ